MFLSTISSTQRSLLCVLNTVFYKVFHSTGLGNRKVNYEASLEIYIHETQTETASGRSANISFKAIFFSNSFTLSI
jgi:hypothetical protein